MIIPSWLVQINLIKWEQVNAILTALDRTHTPHQKINVVPFADLDVPIELMPPHIIPYGSTNLIARLKDRDYTGLFFDDDDFQYPYHCQMRDDMLNSDAIIVSMNDLPTRVIDQDQYFIRPVGDTKLFAGITMTGNKIKEWINTATYNGLPFDSSEQVVLAPAKRIQAEWRYFVVDHKIIDGSMYRANGQMHQKHEDDMAVLKEAQSFAEKWLPADAVCMDLALVDDKVKVVEFNCINGTGFYDHDVDKIVTSLTNFVGQNA